jgi:hypothetical protein
MLMVVAAAAVIMIVIVVVVMEKSLMTNNYNFDLKTMLDSAYQTTDSFIMLYPCKLIAFYHLFLSSLS